MEKIMIIVEQLNIIKDNIQKQLPYYNNAYIAQLRKSDGKVLSEKGVFMNFNDAIGNYFYIRYDVSANIKEEPQNSCSKIYSAYYKGRLVSYVNHPNDLEIAEYLLYSLGNSDSSSVTVDTLYTNKWYNCEEESATKSALLNIDNKSIVMIDFTFFSYITPNICNLPNLCQCLAEKKFVK